MDRGYLHFKRLFQMHQTGAFFVTRAARKTQFKRQCSHPVDRQTGLRTDHTIRLTGKDTQHTYPESLRCISYRDAGNLKHFRFLTNNFLLPAQSVADLYRCRWGVELFFKWMKQHLNIQTFYGHSENAVKTQIWIAVSVYALVAIAKKRLGIEANLYTFLKVLGITVFEKKPAFTGVFA